VLDNLGDLVVKESAGSAAKAMLIGPPHQGDVMAFRES